MKPILVTSYVGPDIDGTASAIAYAEYLVSTGKEAVAGLLGTPHEEARFVLDRFDLEYPNIIDDAEEYDQIVLADASDLAGLGGRVPAEKVIEIIDHRRINDTASFPNAEVQIELVGAAATLVAERFLRDGIDISKHAAILIQSAIISNTLNMKGSVTTDRDREVVEKLSTIYTLSDGYWRELFASKSDLSGGRLQERIRGDFATFELGGKRIGIAQIEMLEGEKLVRERGEEIVRELEVLKSEMGLDIVFQSTIELEDARNIFVAPDDNARQLLEAVFSIQFNGIVAERSDALMRKQIVPLLKKVLETK